MRESNCELGPKLSKTPSCHRRFFHLRVARASGCFQGLCRRSAAWADYRLTQGFGEGNVVQWCCQGLMARSPSAPPVNLECPLGSSATNHLSAFSFLKCRFWCLHSRYFAAFTLVFSAFTFFCVFTPFLVPSPSMTQPATPCKALLHSAQQKDQPTSTALGAPSGARGSRKHTRHSLRGGGKSCAQGSTRCSPHLIQTEP